MIWNVSPIILSVGPLAIRWYSLMFLIGFFLSLYMIKRMCLWENKPEEKIEGLLTYAFLGTLIGARLGHVLFYDPLDYLSNPLSIFKIWEGGLASHGGSIGVVVAVYLFHRKQAEFGLFWLFDRCAVLAIMTGSLIRIGNLMNSEILGRPTNVPWAFIFVRVDGLPRHPVQIYEALCYAVIFSVSWLLYLQKKENTPDGQLLGLVLTGTFTARFFIEFLKEDQSAFEKGMILNMGQILSIPFVLAGIFLMIRSKSRLLPSKPG